MLRLWETGKSFLSNFERRDEAHVAKGHISRDCTAPNGGPLNSAGKVCYKCGQAGHISRDCTTAETNGQIGGGLDGAVDQVPAASTTAVA